MLLFNGRLRLLIFAAFFVVALVFEALRPLRRTTQPKGRRLAVNLGIAALGWLLVRAGAVGVLMRVSQQSAFHRWGLLGLLDPPRWARPALGLLLLDYTLYLWHAMNHRLPFLWRFHSAHHADLDMDVSTASRFHFGELFFSNFFRAAQICLIGVNPFTLVLFETLITVATQFHHSNTGLPRPLERLLCRLIVTPRMHGIHHSLVRDETDSNYSTIFSFWDSLHRSLKLNVKQEAVQIGLPYVRGAGEAGFLPTLALPFRKAQAWRLPDGRVPTRDSAELE